MIKKLINIYRREKLNPSILSLLINPYYFVKKGLIKGLKKNSHYMNGIMLDFGCGNKSYRDIFNVKRHIGLDIQQGGHDHSDEPIDIFYSGKVFPFKDECFDSVLCIEVFEHIFNIDEVLSELYRVMKKNAYILISTPFVWEEHEIPYDFGRYTSFGIKHLLKNHSLKIINIEKSSNYIETVFQMLNVCLFKTVFPTNKYLKALMIPIFIFPTTLIGILLSKVFPKNFDFYHNNIIVAKKCSYN